MADKMRWRWGPPNDVHVATFDSDVIQIGDLVWQDEEGRGRPAETAAGARFFARNFLGVAMTRSRKGELESIRVATSGCFLYDCPPQTALIGTLTRLYLDAVEGGAGLSQAVTATGEPKEAIGRCMRMEATPAEELYIKITSTVMDGGVQSRDHEH